MVSQPQSVTVTALLIGVAGFVVGALFVVLLSIPGESEVDPNAGAGIPGATGQLQQPGNGNLQGGTNPQPPAGGGLQGGSQMTERQARQLLQ